MNTKRLGVALVLAAGTVPVGAGVVNVAPSGVVSASGTYLGDVPANVVDGNLSTSWNAGGYAPAWVKLDLSVPWRVFEIRAFTEQSPGGSTRHDVYLDEVPTYSWVGYTDDAQWLTYAFPQPVDATAVRISTLSSPSWVAWNEIQVLAQPSSSRPTEVLLAPGSTWEYTFVNPTADPNWNRSTGVGGDWSAAPAPFGNLTDGDFRFATPWPADGNREQDDLWLRTEVDLTGFDLESIRWSLGVDNGYTLYANGELISREGAEETTYRWEYAGDFAEHLLSGPNVIAVALNDWGGYTAFDMQITGRRSVVPLPAPLWLLGAGFLSYLGLGFSRRRQS